MPVLNKDETVNRVRQLLLLKVSGARGISKRSQGNGIRSEPLWDKFLREYNWGSRNTMAFDDLQHLVRNWLHLGTRACSDLELRLFFDAVDADGSGTIDLQEFLAYVQRKDVLRGTQVLASVMRAVRTAWERRRLKSDSQETMSKRRLPANAYVNSVAGKDTCDALFADIDLDIDGKLSHFEVQRFMREAIGLSVREVSNNELRALLKLLDADSSGFIDRHEFEEFVRCCCRSHEFRAAAHGPYFQRRARESSSVPALPTIACDGDARVKLPPLAKGMPSASGSIASKVTEPSGCYLRMPGATRMNRIEDRVFALGVDVRGGMFSNEQRRQRAVSSAMEPIDRGGYGLATRPPAKFSVPLSFFKQNHVPEVY